MTAFIPLNIKAELTVLEDLCRYAAQRAQTTTVIATWRQWNALLQRDAHLYPIGTTHTGMFLHGIKVIPPEWDKVPKPKRPEPVITADEFLRRHGHADLTRSDFAPRYRPHPGHRQPGRRK